MKKAILISTIILILIPVGLVMADHQPAKTDGRVIPISPADMSADFIQILLEGVTRNWLPMPFGGTYYYRDHFTVEKNVRDNELKLFRLFDPEVSAQVLYAEITLERSGEDTNPAESACGFVFRDNNEQRISEPDNFLVTQIAMDGKDSFWGLNYGTLVNYSREEFTEPNPTNQKHKLAIFANGMNVVVLIDGVEIRNLLDVPVTSVGQIFYAIKSESASGYGTRCTFENVYLFVPDTQSISIVNPIHEAESVPGPAPIVSIPPELILPTATHEADNGPFPEPPFGPLTTPIFYETPDDEEGAHNVGMPTGDPSIPNLGINVDNLVSVTIEPVSPIDSDQIDEILNPPTETPFPTQVPIYTEVPTFESIYYPPYNRELESRKCNENTEKALEWAVGEKALYCKTAFPEGTWQYDYCQNVEKFLEDCDNGHLPWDFHKFCLEFELNAKKEGYSTDTEECRKQVGPDWEWDCYAINQGYAACSWDESYFQSTCRQVLLNREKYQNSPDPAFQKLYDLCHGCERFLNADECNNPYWEKPQDCFDVHMRCGDNIDYVLCNNLDQLDSLGYDPSRLQGMFEFCKRWGLIAPGSQTTMMGPGGTPISPDGSKSLPPGLELLLQPTYVPTQPTVVIYPTPVPWNPPEPTPESWTPPQQTFEPWNPDTIYNPGVIDNVVIPGFLFPSPTPVIR